MKQALLLCITFFCLSSIVFAEEIKIGSGATGVENIFQFIIEPAPKDIGLVINVESTGLIQSWKDLDSGKIDAAVGGVDLQYWASMMKKEGYVVEQPLLVKYTGKRIGSDTIKLLVNKEINIKEINKTNLKKIFTGEINNWQSLGGPDLSITVVLPAKAQGMTSIFKDKILEGEEYSKNIVYVGTAAESKHKVVSTSGAITIGTITQVDSSVNSPRCPVINRPITLVTKNPSPAPVTKLENYIKGEGQKHLVKILENRS